MSGYTALVSLVLSVAVSQPEVSSATSCVAGEPPRFTSTGEPPGDVLVDLEESGDNLVLSCGVNGTFPITVSWFREDTIIFKSLLTSEEDNGTLSIRVDEVLAPRDGTNYYCIANNTIGPASITFATLRSEDTNVSSSFFDGFMSREPEVATIENGDVALECALNASNPAPNITWFANDSVIQNTELSSKIELLEGGRYLFIPDLTADERWMRYHCQVNNFLMNGLPIRSPTTYTLSADIPKGITVYNRQSTLSGRVGEALHFVFVAAAHGASGLVTVSMLCPDNPAVMFTGGSGTSVSVMLTEQGSSEDQVIFTCQIGALVFSERIDVTGIIVVLSKSFHKWIRFPYNFAPTSNPIQT